MTVTFPVSLKKPTVENFNIAPKKRNESTLMEQGEERMRGVTLGDVYTATGELSYTNKVSMDAFDSFLKYDINYGNDEFFADWFVGLGFTADTYSFRFTNINEVQYGYKRVYQVQMLFQPKTDVSAASDPWADTTVDGGYVFIRFGCISPSSDVVSTADSTHLTLNTGEVAANHWRVGWKFVTYNRDSGERLSGPHTIDTIVDDTITFSPASSPVVTVSEGIRFADYDEVDISQKIYAFISDDDNVFVSDGGLPYDITYG